MIKLEYETTYPDLKQLFDVCKREAERHGFHYFGIQFYSECWGGHKEDQYDKYGDSTECGIGTQGYGAGYEYTNYVYGRAKRSSCIAVLITSHSHHNNIHKKITAI